LGSSCRIGYALPRADAHEFEDKFRSLNPAPWAIATFEDGREYARGVVPLAIDTLRLPDPRSALQEGISGGMAALGSVFTGISKMAMGTGRTQSRGGRPRAATKRKRRR
jgi:hypothetical protein